MHDDLRLKLLHQLLADALVKLGQMGLSATPPRVSQAAAGLLLT
jgi:hypothetical protein